MAAKQFNTRPDEVVGVGVDFEVDGETFTTVPAGSLPAGFLWDATEIIELLVEVQRQGGADKMSPLDLVRIMRLCARALDEMLDEDSAQRFSARLRDRDRRIDPATAMDVLMWLIEEVFAGGHPTTPSSSQPPGLSTGDGTDAGRPGSTATA